MKKYFFTLSLFLFFTCSLFAKPMFNGSKYIIACQYDNAKGALIPNAGEYKLIYNPIIDSESAPDSAYWFVKEEAPGEYSIQNSASKKYIKHNTTAGVLDRWALDLVSSLQPDKSTSFNLEFHQSGNLCYYSIRSVVNNTKIWERRTASHTDAITGEDVFAVGLIVNPSDVHRNFIFYDLEGQSVSDDQKVEVQLVQTRPTLGAFAAQMSSFTVGDKVPVVDLAKKQFFLTVQESQIGQDVTLGVNYVFTNAAYSLYIGGTKVASGTDYTFKNMTGHATYPVEIRNGSTVVASGTFIISCLPLVQVISDQTVSSTYNIGRFVVTEPDKFGPSEVLLSELRTRGFYAGRQEKKSFAVKLKDVDGVTPIDRSYLNLRNDNNWVLDAMYNDSCRMKNRVSTDFWEAYSARPYYAEQEPDMVNGTRGRFVEVFLNDSYNGLYCMTEKVDRQQLKVKKLVAATAKTPAIQRGVVIKADDWSDPTLFGVFDKNTTYTAPSPNSETWSGYSVKYPDVAEGEPFNWQTLVDAVNVVTYSSSAETFKTKLEDYFDMPVFRDYYLLLDLLLLTDNHGKNLYLYIYDQTVSPRMSIAPWDLDSSWGRFWDGTGTNQDPNRMRPDQTLESFISSYVPRQSTLYKRLMETNVWGFNDKLKARYRELRGTYFNHDSIMARFQKYNALFNVSGAGDREMVRWNFKTINSDLNYTSKWLKARLAFMDKQYLGGPYVPPVVGVEDVDALQISLSPNPVRDIMTISNVKSGDLIQVISLQGLVVMKTKADGTMVQVDMSPYAPGVYMVKVGTTINKIVKY